MRNLEKIAAEAWLASFQHVHVFLLYKSQNFWGSFVQSDGSDSVAEVEHALQSVYEDLPYKPSEALSFTDCFQGAVYPAEQSKLDRYRTSVGFKTPSCEAGAHFDTSDPREGPGVGYRVGSCSSSTRQQQRGHASDRSMEKQKYGEERRPTPVLYPPDNSAAS